MAMRDGDEHSVTIDDPRSSRATGGDGAAEAGPDGTRGALDARRHDGPALDAGRGHAATILVIDDDPSIVDYLTFALQPTWRVVTASSAAAGFAVLSERRVDAIVVDLMMPVMDGEAFCLELADRGSGLPIALMSARDDVGEVGRRVGACAVLRKPFTLRALREAVRTIAARRISETLAVRSEP
jgi:CheY-like chemotaxis protein